LRSDLPARTDPAATADGSALPTADGRRRPRVVIVGAGFGGLTAARALKRQPVDVLVVDRHNYHLFTPLLYQVASALLDPGEIAQPIRALLRPLGNADFRMAAVTGFDLEGHRVLTDHGDLAYDYLVLAAGSQSNYFGNTAVEKHAMGLKELPEGLALRNWVLGRFEHASWTEDPGERRRLLTFAVVGGGPTGVETAGALSELMRMVLRREYRGLPMDEVRVVLIEGGRQVLGTFDPRLSAEAARSLESKHVEVWLEALVEDADAGGVTLKDGRRLDAATVIWTAGVRGADVGAKLGVPLARGARVPVEPTLQLADRPQVLVIGDLASLEQDREQLPMLIPVAMQEAKHAAATIGRLLRGQPAEPFRYHDPGIMATIGRNSGVAQLGRIKLSGFLGWVMWLVVHLINVVTFRDRVVVLVNWAWDYLLYDRPVRLIVRAGEKD
jgi:NADH dehydrogenase